MGTIVFKLTGQNAEALKAFLELDEAQRKLIGTSQKVGEATKKTSDTAKDAAKDMTNLGGEMYSSFNKVLGILGIGGGLAGGIAAALSAIKGEIGDTKDELDKLRKISDEVLAKAHAATTGLPGGTAENVGALATLTDWARKNKIYATQEEIRQTYSQYSTIAGSQATTGQKIEGAQAALTYGATGAYDPTAFAQIQASLVRAYGAEMLKDRKRLNDLTINIMKTGTEEASQIQNSMQAFAYAKEAGMSPEDTIALLMSSVKISRSTEKAQILLQRMAMPKEELLKPRQPLDVFKDPREYQIYKQLMSMSEDERQKKLESDDVARKAWYGREVSKDTYEQNLFSQLSPEEKLKGIKAGRFNPIELFGNRVGVGMLGVVQESDKVKENLFKPEAEGAIPINKEYMRNKKLAVQKEWQEKDKAAAYEYITTMRETLKNYEEASRMTEQSEERGFFGFRRELPSATFDRMVALEKPMWGREPSKISRREIMDLAQSGLKYKKNYERYMKENYPELLPPEEPAINPYKDWEPNLFKFWRPPIRTNPQLPNLGKASLALFPYMLPDMKRETPKVKLSDEDGIMFRRQMWALEHGNQLGIFHKMNEPTW